jgi:hypothetical protein
MASSSGVTVSISPSTANVAIATTEQFQATVTGSSNTGIAWEVNGFAGGNSAAGTISATGLYQAPAVLPAIVAVIITALSVADPQASAAATVTLTAGIGVTVSPSTAGLTPGGAQIFAATISGAGGSVTWSVNGIPGGNSVLGTILSSGATTAIYIAPSIPPAPAAVTITATSVVDTSKSASATVTITCSASGSLSPSAASVSLAKTQMFTASFCVASGTAILWDVNGIASGNAGLGTIVPTGPGSNTALYTAPADLPASNPLTVHATIGSGPDQLTASAVITVASNVSVTVSPPIATVATSQSLSLSAAVVNSTDQSVTWSVNGIPNGNPASGQICLTGTNPCVAPPLLSTGAVFYVAPGFMPAVNPISIAATSNADHSRSGIAVITVGSTSGSVAITVSPSYAFIPASSGTLSTQQFFAAVTGSSNAAVTWSVASAVSGQGCGGSACGAVNSTGLYSAATFASSPNAIAVIATSVADPTKSASATIALTSGPTVETLLPSSVFAGAVESFPLSVEGVNFVAGSGGSASAILLNGTPRSTTCATSTGCTTVINPVDVESSGTITIQVQAPGPSGVLSNPVPFVIAPFDASVDVISLTSSQDIPASEDIIVVEPTTAAESSAINVDFIGLLANGSCGVQGSPLTVTRPTSGSAVVSLCVHGTGLDPTFTYAFTGPTPADIGVTASAVTGLFPNTIELDLQLSSTTLPGVRSLFITTLNNDRAVATGMLEIE